jgi:hypothetical protein
LIINFNSGVSPPLKPQEANMNLVDTIHRLAGKRDELAPMLHALVEDGLNLLVLTSTALRQGEDGSLQSILCPNLNKATSNRKAKEMHDKLSKAASIRSSGSGVSTKYLATYLAGEWSTFLEVRKSYDLLGTKGKDSMLLVNDPEWEQFWRAANTVSSSDELMNLTHKH